MNLDSIWTKILEIPSPFWAALLGAAGPFIGILLTNRANNHRLENQFTHERELRLHDRQENIRKEIYLEAAEAMHSASIMISRYCDVSISDEKLMEDFIKRSPSIAKLNLVGSQKVIEAATKTSEFIAGSVTSLAIERANLIVLNGLIQSTKSQTDRQLVLQDAALEVMRNCNLEKDYQRWAAAQTQFEFHSSEISSLIQDQEERQIELFRRTSLFAIDCARKSLELQELAVSVATAIRSDMRIKTDRNYEQTLRTLIKNQSAEVETRIKAMGVLEANLKVDPAGTGRGRT